MKEETGTIDDYVREEDQQYVEDERPVPVDRLPREYLLYSDDEEVDEPCSLIIDDDYEDNEDE